MNDSQSPPLLMLGRVLAVDWGLARIGLAVSDGTRTLATPLATLHEKDKRAQIERVVSLIASEEINQVIVGLPLHLDGRESPSTLSARRYAEKLATRVTIPIELADERYTSVEAESRLAQAGARSAKGGARTRDEKGRIDSAAAAVLLQGWLDTQSVARARARDSRGPETP